MGGSVLRSSKGGVVRARWVVVAKTARPSYVQAHISMHIERSNGWWQWPTVSHSKGWPSVSRSGCDFHRAGHIGTGVGVGGSCRNGEGDYPSTTH